MLQAKPTSIQRAPFVHFVPPLEGRALHEVSNRGG